MFLFVFVRRVVKDKGVNELVEAFCKLNFKYPNTRLLLVGPYENDLDPIESHTVTLINNCNAIESVGSKFDVRPWLAASGCFILPSYREGFPNSVIDAGTMDFSF